MESEDHFYLTLPSSSSLDLHSDNKISEFTTELLNAVNLERDAYEVGLSEIILDTEIENVRDREIAFVIYRNVSLVKKILKTSVPKGYVEVEGVRYFQEIFYTKGGVYRSLAELASYFNIKFMSSRICKDLMFVTTKIKGQHMEVLSLKSTSTININNLMTFHIQPYGWLDKGILITNNAAPIEEMHESDVKHYLNLFQRYVPRFNEYLISSKIEFPKAVHFVCDPHVLLRDPGVAYIYTDIVEHQYVGDTKAPLLRVVRFPKDSQVVSFPHIHYLPLSRTRIGSIKVYIRDVEGKAYPFADGTAVFKLHFRKKLH